MRTQGERFHAEIKLLLRLLMSPGEKFIIVRGIYNILRGER